MNVTAPSDRTVRRHVVNSSFSKSFDIQVSCVMYIGVSFTLSIRWLRWTKLQQCTQMQGGG